MFSCLDPIPKSRRFEKGDVNHPQSCKKQGWKWQWAWATSDVQLKISSISSKCTKCLLFLLIFLDQVINHINHQFMSSINFRFTKMQEKFGSIIELMEIVVSTQVWLHILRATYPVSAFLQVRRIIRNSQCFSLIVFRKDKKNSVNWPVPSRCTYSCGPFLPLIPMGWNNSPRTEVFFGITCILLPLGSVGKTTKLIILRHCRVFSGYMVSIFKCLKCVVYWVL